MSWTRAHAWLMRTLFAERSETGGNLVEYMLLLVLIAVMVIVVLTHIGMQVSTRFSSASSAMP